MEAKKEEEEEEEEEEEGGGEGEGEGEWKGKGKEKRKDKDKVKILETMGMSKKSDEERGHCLDKHTQVKAAFQKTQEKQKMERILKKASKIHKQRVEHFIVLTEHYEIPKVSWTK
uniref:Protein FAM32A n=1 Tax=Mus spicilegus TaxID=10103 RepID=A0A8C6GDG6_MUSSI